MIIAICGAPSLYSNKMIHWEDTLIKNGVTCLLPALCYKAGFSGPIREEDFTKTKMTQFNKISISDAILVILDKDEKVDVTTVEEILYAQNLKKRIFFTQNNSESKNLIEIKKEDWNESFIERMKLYEFKIMNKNESILIKK